MTSLPAPPRFTLSPYLVDLVAETERLAQAVADAERRDELVDDRLVAAALATLRLDGSPVAAPPDPTVAAAADAVAGAVVGDTTAEARRGTWLDAMRSGTDAAVDEAAQRQVQALEYLGARAGLASDDLAAPLLTEPLDALSQLHRRLTRGLVAPERAGAPRRSEQAVHDASVGRIIYFPTEPRNVPRELALVVAWLASSATREHGLVVSGVLQHELLRIHPYEAANGRLARTAARLVLRARGLDPSGLAAAEVPLAADPIGYYDEVARTVRRRDLGVWLERWGEAVTAALRDAARRLGALGPDVPARAAGFVADRDAFTLADYRAGVAAAPEEARRDLAALLDAGLVERVPGSRGLRFRVP